MTDRGSSRRWPCTPGRARRGERRRIALDPDEHGTFRQDAVGEPRGEVRIRPQRQPDPPSAGGAPSPPSRGQRTGWPMPPGWRRRRTSCTCSEPEGRILLSDDAYGGTWRLASKVWGRSGCRPTVVDLSDLDALAGRAHRAGRPDGLGPDAHEPAAQGGRRRRDRADGRRRRRLTVVDNTFATPFLQRPLELGAPTSSCARPRSTCPDIRT